MIRSLIKMREALKMKTLKKIIILTYSFIMLISIIDLEIILQRSAQITQIISNILQAQNDGDKADVTNIR